MIYIKKSKQKIILAIIISMLVIPLFTGSKILANSVGVSASNNGNGTYSIGVGSSLTGAVNVSTSTGGSAKFWCEAGSCSLQAGSATYAGSGTVTVTATPVNPMDDGNGGVVTATGSSASVNVTTPTAPTPGAPTPETPTPPANTEEEKKPDEVKEGVNTLASLTVSEGKLTPAFNPTTTEYDVNLPAGTTKFTIDASATSAKASVEGIGAKDVVAGDNTFEVICRGEDGSTTTYIVRVHVSEKPVTTVSFDGGSLGILSDGASPGNLFEETKIKVNGKEVKAWTNKTLNITLLYMQDEKTNQKDFYIYDTKKKSVTSIYRPFAYNGKNLVMIDVPKTLQNREGMKFTEIKLGEMTLPGWNYTDQAFKNYALIYVMDEMGKTVYYQYEKKEDNLQLYSGMAAIQQDDYQALVSSNKQKTMIYTGVIAVLAIMSICTLGSTIIFYRKRNKVKYKKVDIKDQGESAEAKSLLHSEE